MKGRRSHRTTLLVAGCALVAAILVPAVASGAPSHAPPEGPAAVCGDLLPVEASHFCTHGGDPVPHLPTGIARIASAAAPTMARCPGNGRGGKRIRVFYGYPDGTTNDVKTARPQIQEALAYADANLDAQTPGVDGQHYRFWCKKASHPVISPLRLVAIGADNAFSVGDVATSLQQQIALGLGPVDYTNGRFDMVVFVDHLSGVSAPAGQATLWMDDGADPATNRNNQNWAKFAMVTFGYQPLTEAYIAQHEIGHNLGAVQDSAPHSSGAGHCFETADIMCYDDGGPYFSGGGSLVNRCPAMPDGQSPWDCGNDDWYAAAPAPGTYLETHWNVADSGWLTKAN